jgi:hypothetical protein
VWRQTLPLQPVPGAPRARRRGRTHRSLLGLVPGDGCARRGQARRRPWTPRGQLLAIDLGPPTRPHAAYARDRPQQPVQSHGRSHDATRALGDCRRPPRPRLLDRHRRHLREAHLRRTLVPEHRASRPRAGEADGRRQRML